MVTLNKRNFLFVLSIFIISIYFVMPTSVFAKVGSTVKFPVFVIKPGDDKQIPQPNTFVNMYEIKLVNDDYVGKLVSTLSTGKKGKSAIFNVKPGKVVHFLGFSDKALAFETTTHTPFTTPPFKNFSTDDGIKGQLCLTDGIFFDKKFGTTAEDESAKSIACTKKGANIELTNGNIVKYPVIVIKPDDELQSPIPNVFINMYEIRFVNDEYAGKLVSTLSTGKKGTSAVFKVKPGQVVHFLGFETKNQAKKTITYSPFTTPPYKNFSIYDGVLGQLCYTDGVDFTKKLGETQNDGQALSIACSKGPAAVYLIDTNNSAAPAASTPNNLKKDYSNDTVAPQIISVEGKYNFVSKANFNYGTEVKTVATDDSGQIAKIIMYAYNVDNPIKFPLECGQMDSPATCDKLDGGFDFGATYEYYAEVYDLAGNKTVSEKKYFKTPVK